MTNINTDHLLVRKLCLLRMTRSDWKSRVIPWEQRYLAAPLTRVSTETEHDQIQSGALPIIGKVITQLKDYFIKVCKQQLVESLLFAGVNLVGIVSALILAVRSWSDKTSFTLAMLSLLALIYDVINHISDGTVKTVVRSAEDIFTWLCTVMEAAMPYEPGTIDLAHSGEYDNAPNDLVQSASGNMKNIVVAGLSVASILSRFCGYDISKGIAHINTNVSFAKSIEEDLSDLLLELFGVDINGTGALKTALADLEKEGNDLNAMAALSWNGDTLIEANAWKKRAEEFCRTVKKGVTLTRLQAIITSVTSKIEDTTQAMHSIKPRPVPVGVYLYGEPGRGKTSMVNHFIIPTINKAFKLEGARARAYDLNSGKHFRKVMGEAHAIYDEYGAAAKAEQSNFPPSALNAILSGGSATIPGAGLTEKHQTAAFNVVYILGNNTPDNIPTGLTGPAKQAFLSRLIKVKVSDPQYDQNRGRANQHHRAPDYSHLQCRIDGQALVRTPTQLVDVIIDRLRTHQRNFVDMHKAEAQVPDFTTAFELWNPLDDTQDRTSLVPPPQPAQQPAAPIAVPAAPQQPPRPAAVAAAATAMAAIQPAPLVAPPTQQGAQPIPTDATASGGAVPKVKKQKKKATQQDRHDLVFGAVPQDIVQSGSTLRTVMWVAGPPGCGKSQTLKPDICMLAQSIGYTVHYGYTTAPNTFVVLDDVVDPCTKKGQEEFAQFYNNMNPSSCALVISNFGPHIRFPSYGRLSKIHRIPDILPAFPRRAGLQGPLHFEYYGSGVLEAVDKKTYTVTEAMRKMLEIHNRMKIPEIITSTPPLETVWDVDLNVQETDIPAIIKALPKSFKTVRAMPHLRPILSILQANANACIEYQMQSIGQYIQQKIPDLAIRVIRQQQTIAFAGGKLYLANDVEQTPEINGNTAIFRSYEPPLVVARAHFERVRDSTVDIEQMYYQREDLLKLILMKHQSGVQWRAMDEAWPVSSYTTLHRWSKAIKDRAAALLEHVKKNAFVYLLLVALVIYLRTLARNKASIQECVCKTWRLDYPTTCPFDDVQGKGRGSGGKHAHFKSVRMGNKILYEDDIGNYSWGERLWHSLSMHAKQYGTTDFTYSHGALQARATYDEGDMAWHITSLDTADGRVRNNPVVENVKKQIFRAGCGLSELNAIALTDKVAVFPRHLLVEGGSSEVYLFNHEGWTIRVDWEDSYRELCWGTFMKDGAPRAFPGLKDLTRHLTSLDTIRTVSTASLVIPRDGGYDTHSHEYKFEEITAPGFGLTSIAQWGANIGFIPTGEHKELCTNGDCGSPVFLHLGDQVKLGGMHVVTRMHLSKLGSAVLCTELWNEYVTRMRGDTVQSSEAHVQSIQEQYDQVDWNAIEERPVVVPQQLSKILHTKPRGVTYHPQGSVELLGYINNQKPMESTFKRDCFDDFPETLRGFDKKVPCLTEAQVYNEHRDRIPADAAGLQHVFLIRAKRLETNAYAYHLEEMMFSAAIDLADMYALKFNLKNIHPLSLDECVRGGPRCRPLTIDSSAGALYAMMYNIRMKEQIFDAETRDWKIEGVKELTEHQHLLARHGIRLSIPCDANYKGEALSEEKAWKLRVFYNVPTNLVLNLKRYLGAIQHEFEKLGTDAPHQYAMYPLVHWNELAQKLLSVSNNIVCVDASAYDHGLGGVAIRSVGKYVTRLLSKGRSDLDMSRTALAVDTLFEELAFMPILFKNTLVQKRGGYPSGAYGTTMTDSVSWDVMLLVCWMILTDRDITDYDSLTCRYFCGDDLIFSVHHSVKHEFNAITVAKTMHDLFQIKVTPAADKNGELVPYTTIDEASFCSRMFAKLPEHPSVRVPKLKTASIYGALTYSALPDPAARLEQYLACRNEILPYGQEKYECFEAELAQFARKHGLQHTPLPWKSAVARVWQEVTTAPHDTLEDANSKRLKALAELSHIQPLKLQPLPESSEDMSSKDMKALRKAIFTKLSQALTYNAFLGSTIAERETLASIPPSLIGFGDQQEWKCPGKPEATAHTPSFRSTADCVWLTGSQLYPDSDFARWNSMPVSTVDSQRAKHYNVTRKAMQALLDLHAGLYRDCEGTWDYVKHRYSSDDRVQAGDTPGAPAAAPAANASTAGASTGHVDNATAPLMTVTPAVTLPSAEVMGSDVSQGSTVMQSTGGLDPLGLVNLSTANNVVEMCYKFNQVKVIQISSNTAMGVTLFEFRFNPWEADQVSEAIKWYGMLHDFFSGAIQYQFTTTTSTANYGEITIVAVPCTYKGDIRKDARALKALPHVRLNMSTNGASVIEITGGSLTDCAISKAKIDAGEIYFTIVAFASTPIGNAYGAEIPISIIMEARLGPTAYFSNVSFLSTKWSTGGDGGGTGAAAGPTPPSAAVVFTDGENYLPTFPVSTTVADVPLNSAQPFNMLPSLGIVTDEDKHITNVLTQQQKGGVRWGATVEVLSAADLEQVTGMNSYWGTQFRNDTNPEAAEMNGVEDLGDNQMLHHQNGNVTVWHYTGLTASMNGVLAEDPDNPNWRLDLGAEQGACEIFFRKHKWWASDQEDLMSTPTGKTLATKLITKLDNILTPKVTGNPTVNDLVYRPMKARDWKLSDVSGAPVCDTSVPQYYATPSGFIRVVYDNELEFIPGLQGSIVGKPTIYQPAEHNRFLESVRNFLTAYNLKSYTYTVATATGSYVMQIVCNQYGVFASSVEGDYLLLNNATGLIYTNYQSSSSNEWPTLTSLDASLFNTRVVSSRGSFAYKGLGAYKASIKRGDTHKGVNRDDLMNSMQEDLKRVMNAQLRMYDGMQAQSRTMRLLKESTQTKSTATQTDDRVQSAAGMIAANAIGGAASGAGGAVGSIFGWKKRVEIANINAAAMRDVATINTKGTVLSSGLQAAAAKYVSNQRLAASKIQAQSQLQALGLRAANQMNAGGTAKQAAGHRVPAPSASGPRVVENAGTQTSSPSTATQGTQAATQQSEAVSGSTQTEAESASDPSVVDAEESAVPAGAVRLNEYEASAQYRHR